MADVYTYVTETGTIVPDTTDILSEVQQEFLSAFGSDLNLSPSSPQGLLITIEALARAAVADNNAALANQINPNLAGGVFLDAILALTGTQRTAATYTTVSCNLTGVAGTIVPAGSLAQTVVTAPDLPEQFALQSQVTLTGGTVAATFVAVNSGPVQANIGTLTQIISNVIGWETITNPALPTNIGAATQSDANARLYRQQTLFAQGSSLAGAMMAAVQAVTGVTSLFFQENTAATTQVVNGVTMVAHSIYACINGGDDTAVATALVSKKSGGCAYNNGASASPVSVNITEPFSGQVMTVLFDRPDKILVEVQVTAHAPTTVTDPVAVIKKAINDYAMGLLDGEPGLTVGTSVSVFELAGAINQEAPSIVLINVEIKKDGDPSYSNNPIAIDPWQVAFIDQVNVILQ